MMAGGRRGERLWPRPKADLTLPLTFENSMTGRDKALMMTTTPEAGGPDPPGEDESSLLKPSAIPDVHTFGPALRSLWFLFFGLVMGPAVLILGRDPQGQPLMWLGLSFLCLGLILHRLSLKYTLTNKKIEVRSWWGRGPVESVSLDQLGQVRARSGLAGRLAGVVHLEVLSLAPDETGLTLLGQSNPQALIERLESLAARARAGANGADGRP